jgi:hypothetical protein
MPRDEALVHDAAAVWAHARIACLLAGLGQRLGAAARHGQTPQLAKQIDYERRVVRRDRNGQVRALPNVGDDGLRRERRHGEESQREQDALRRLS